jgi:predicted Zn-dependent peptidase
VQGTAWCAIVALIPSLLAAQATKQASFDRSVQPAAGKAPEMKVPSWTKTRLANGAELIVSVKRGLPLVSVSMDFLGGSAQFEDPAKLGTAALTSQMMVEGTTTRTGDQLADAQQMLGTNIFVSVGRETGSAGFTALADKLDGAFAIMADMLLNPSFPADALVRRRGQMLVNLTQAKDQPNSIANEVFAKVVYGDEHPYGRVVGEKTVTNVTRDDIVAFHRAYFRPGRAIVTVVGDVDPARVRASFERAFAAWPAGGDRPSFAYPPVPQSKSTTIYIVDKPKSAQSVFALGTPGPSRDTPDYYALAVMNNLLGGLFQSRLNNLIREVKGYSYGVNSSFAYGRGPGAFRAGGGIITAKTDSALIDFMAELKGVQGGKPFTEDEVIQGKESLIQRLPSRFAGVNAATGAISSVYVQGLEEDYWQNYAKNIAAVTADDLVRVARKYIDLNNFNLIIVGDRAVIEEPLRKTGIAPIVVLDIEGKPVNTVVP